MFKTFHLVILRRAHAKAHARAEAYARQFHWNVLVQIALDQAACEAANRLARAINPAAITRAF